MITRLDIADEGEHVFYSLESTQPTGLTAEQAVEWLGQWLDEHYHLTVHHSATGILPVPPLMVGGTVMPELKP